MRRAKAYSSYGSVV